MRTRDRERNSAPLVVLLAGKYHIRHADGERRRRRRGERRRAMARLCGMVVVKGRVCRASSVARRAGIPRAHEPPPK